MARAITYGLMVWLLAGCAEGSEPIWLTCHGSETFCQEAMEAADEWMDVCGAEILVNTEPGGVPLREVQTATGLEGYTQGNTIVSHKTGRPTSMEVTSSAPDRPGALRHEMGHALGLGHSSYGIMRAPHEPGTRVTKEDCSHLRK